MQEYPSLSQRIARIARVTGAVSGAAVKTLGAKLTGNDDSIPDIITETLGRLKGPIMKVGQILSIVSGILPEHLAESLMQLQSNAPSMGWSFVRRRMSYELGDDWQQHFQHFQREASAGASLGQVHKAQLHDGRWVACKLQYPNMHTIIQGDLDQLAILLNIFERTTPILDTEFIQAELKERLLEELDYTHELATLEQFQSIFQTSELNVYVPTPIPHLSTNRLLTMEWVEGVSLVEVKNLPLEQRNHIASNLFNAWYYPLYRHGILHGDPHFGNYKITPEGHIILLDFGCSRQFSSTFMDGVRLLYNALASNNLRDAQQAYQLWGFNGLTPELVEALNIWATFLYEPLLEDRVRPLVTDPALGKAAAKSVINALKQTGKVRPPKEFVFMDRAAVGIGSAMIHLGAELNWHQMFQRLVL